jgi:hypothetical protein
MSDESISPFLSYILAQERKDTFLREGAPIADPSPFSTPPFLSSFFVQERKDILYPPYWALQK